MSYHRIWRIRFLTRRQSRPDIFFWKGGSTTLKGRKTTTGQTIRFVFCSPDVSFFEYIMSFQNIKSKLKIYAQGKVLLHNRKCLDFFCSILRLVFLVILVIGNLVFWIRRKVQILVCYIYFRAAWKMDESLRYMDVFLSPFFTEDICTKAWCRLLLL